MAQGAVLCETGPARHVLWTGTGGSRGSRLRVHLQHLHFLTFWEVVSVSFRARIGGFASLTARELRWGAHSSACFGTVVVLCWRTEDHGRCIVSRRYASRAFTDTFESGGPAEGLVDAKGTLLCRGSDGQSTTVQLLSSGALSLDTLQWTALRTTRGAR